MAEAALTAHRQRHHRGGAGGRSIQTLTSQPSNPSPHGQPTLGARARTLAAQGLVNRIVRGLLRTPLLCRVVGNRLITVYVIGHKSGRHYAVPVAYTRHDGLLLIGTPFVWGRNLRTGPAGGHSA